MRALAKREIKNLQKINGLKNLKEWEIIVFIFMFIPVNSYKKKIDDEILVFHHQLLRYF